MDSWPSLPRRTTTTAKAGGKKADKPVDIASKTVDPAAAEMLQKAYAEGISTAFSRADSVKACPIGAEGACCKVCFMGPCRFTGKDKESIRGVCGATQGTVAARNMVRYVAAGAAAHSDHGRDLALALRAVAKGELCDYEIKDTAKLYKVAEIMGIEIGDREVNEIALDVAEEALANFGRQEGELTYIKRAPAKRQEIWRKLDIVPRGIDREIVESLHRTHEGTDQSVENLMMHALRCSLGDGWGGAMLATDISDIMFGTPDPGISAANLGVLDEEKVNIVVHGHDPLWSEMVVAATQDPEMIAYAESKGAKGFQVSGICCTANEMLMRHNVPVAGNFLHQELAIMTGAVDVMVVDVQCVMQALATLTEDYHTKLVTSSPKARIDGAIHMPMDEEHPLDSAKEVVKFAADNFTERGDVTHPRPQERDDRRVQPRVPELHARRQVPGFVQAAQRRDHVRAHPRSRRHGGLLQPARAPGRGQHRADEGVHQERRPGRRHGLRGNGLRQAGLPAPGGGPRARRTGPQGGLRGGRHPAGAALGQLRGQLAHPHGPDADDRRRRPGRRHLRHPGCRASAPSTCARRPSPSPATSWRAEPTSCSA